MPNWLRWDSDICFTFSMSSEGCRARHTSDLDTLSECCLGERNAVSKIIQNSGYGFNPNTDTHTCCTHWQTSRSRIEVDSKTKKSTFWSQFTITTRPNWLRWDSDICFTFSMSSEGCQPKHTSDLDTLSGCCLKVTGYVLWPNTLFYANIIFCGSYISC